MPYDRTTGSYDREASTGDTSIGELFLVYHPCGCGRKCRFSPGSRAEAEFVRLVQERPCRRHRHLALTQ